MGICDKEWLSYLFVVLLRVFMLYDECSSTWWIAFKALNRPIEIKEQKCSITKNK